MYINSKATLIDLLTAAVGVAGTYNGVKVALFTNDVNPNRNSEVADFDIADFGGLTNLKAVVWGVPFGNAYSQAEVMGALLNWLTTAITLLPKTVYGYIMTDTAGTVYILGERFAEPYTFEASGQNLGFVPRLVFDT